MCCIWYSESLEENFLLESRRNKTYSIKGNDYIALRATYMHHIKHIYIYIYDISERIDDS